MGGSVPEGWTRVRLGQVATIARGTGPRYAAGTGAIVLSQKCIQPIGIDLRWAKEVEKEWHESRASHQLIQAGDVLVNSTGEGTIGRSAFANDGVVGLPFDSHVLAVRVLRERANPAWVAQYLRSHRGAAALDRLKGAKTTNQTELGTARLAEIDLILPPLPEQRAIAAVLDAVDETIERTEAVITATEDLRKALLHDLLTRGVPGWHSEWKQVPGLGTVPACWEVVTLGEVAHRVTDGVHQTVRLQEDGVVPFLYVSALQSSGIDWNSAGRVSMEVYREITKSIRPTVGDVLYAAVGSYGTAVEVVTDKSFTFQRHIAITRPDRSRITPGFLTASLNSPGGRRQADKAAVGLAQKTVTLEALRKFGLALPSLAEQQRITGLLDATAEVLAGSHQGQCELQAAKAALADALLSGRVRVGGSLNRTSVL